jgi:hypothetical protein
LIVVYFSVFPLTYFPLAVAAEAEAEALPPEPEAAAADEAEPEPPLSPDPHMMALVVFEKAVRMIVIVR